MIEQQGKGQTYLIFGAIVMLMASLLFIPFISPTITVILAILIFIFNTRIKYQFQKNWKYILLFSSVFWVYAFGLLYTENMDYGILDIILKFSFLVFPVIFGLLSTKQISINNFHLILQSFVALTFISALLCLFNASNKYMIQGESAVFFYSQLSSLMHPSYYALYLNFALIIMLYQILDTNSISHKSIRITYKILVPFFIVFIILLESKAGLLSLFSILAFVSLYVFIYQKKMKKALVYTSLSIVLISTIFTLIPNSTNRIDAVVESVEEAGTAENHSVSAARIYLWQAAWELFKEKPLFGYGTGDVKDVLLQEYSLQNNTRAVTQNYNPHNQFLQSAVAVGILGLLSMLLIVAFPIYFGFKKRNLLYFLLGILMAINLLVESMFERQAGVMFFTFFNSFIFFVMLQQKWDSANREI